MAYIFLGDNGEEAELPPEPEVSIPVIASPTSTEAVIEAEPALEAMPETMPETAQAPAPAPEAPAETDESPPAEETAETPPADENQTLKEEAVEVIRENKDEIVDSAIDFFKNINKKGNGKKKK
jgi:hypothetical protein